MAIALSIPLGLIALWWALRFLPAGADGYGPLPYLIAFVRFLWMPSALVLAVALASRHWIIAVFAAILILLTGVFVSPWYRKRNIPTNSANSKKLAGNLVTQNTNNPHTVMTLNCRYGLADPQAIVDAVRGNNVSILALQELTPDLVAALDKAGLNTLLPYCQLGKAQESDNGGFNGIYSRTQPDAQAGNAIDIAAADVPSIIVGNVAYFSAHPKSPMRGCREWSLGIRRLAELINRDVFAIGQSSSKTTDAEADHNPVASAHVAMSGTIPIETTATEPNASTTTATTTPSAPTRATVIMGDLNSNLDHPSFRKLLNSGFTDAGLGISHSGAASFPTWLRWPRLELDHVLATPEINISSVQTTNIPGSDHLALLVHLAHT
ncbi:endonuclease/exonuclease/phosphatase family protein [Bifidobacterium sp. ESL0769]|uniref:endonuclease/exonuclease/phosphatase family protein n=1 Tax=Bifidobacterium sp. ESL0769 TaxID=2983229 RepID=UPI0023F878CB|nr:endonuclease/exonuclease/phosphatase family protein [Bifidobacterium sp. ESL0769]WEV67165.1 endonuclease/exonuclease/phosphatase family protein [Bifidobacterium sp. ESL0769]